MSAIIKAQGLKKSYGKKVVLDDVNFEIEEGKIFVDTNGNVKIISLIITPPISLYHEASFHT